MRTPAAALTLALLLVTAPAAADTASGVDSLSVSRAGTTITVNGSATLTDASSAVVGTDPTGDAKATFPFVPEPVPLTEVGMDLTSAKIAAKPDNDQIVFTLAVADPIEQTFTLPEVVGYHWLMKVTNGASSIYYQLQAMRTGQYEQTLPGVNPVFKVNSCAALASGAPNCFEVAGYVEGTMANGIVEWRVPTALIGAFRGATIQEAGSGVRSLISASGAAYYSGGGDQVVTAPYVVGPAVQLALRHVDDDPEATAFDTMAALGPDGTFTGKLAVPGYPGSYDLIARACHGHIASCGTAQASISV